MQKNMPTACTRSLQNVEGISKIKCCENEILPGTSIISRTDVELYGHTNDWNITEWESI
jgi:hypothetical protein